MNRMLFTLLLCCLIAAPASAETVRIKPDRDVTLIEDAEGDVANGSGPTLFAGRTNQPAYGIRRALLRFDVAAAVPRDAVIESVSLRLYQDSQNVEPVPVGLHRVLAGWGEGASSIRGGRGAPAKSGDATWLHSYYDNQRWDSRGGRYISLASTFVPVAGQGHYTWPSSSRLVDDVRLWLRAPEQNFGWMLKANEVTRQSVKRFASREAEDGRRRPVLTVEYHLPVR